MNTIIVNGRKIECSGNSVQINNSTVIVDGKTIADENSKEINVIINGDVTDLECAGSVTVNGTVKGDIDCSGMCEIKGDVDGDVNASGSVSCGKVKGDVMAAGSVSCYYPQQPE